ncbi:HGxxPAAW family protein [Streptomyces pilosus]|uniref:Uncharacterized protein n=1 Tax=Streptomyces pilosus TaxID=28893 RepID=A0A918BL95_9ACTN|nr:HGxxPAAW family protein [Streptomyces pilosus]GGQ72008.1 hypothetical protein GCM10010280_17780 [Streptomyces pilosus]GGV66194.1 hypothetical protein GCM10010261_57870 [Streptomyces pilosus]
MSAHPYDHGHTVAGWTGFAVAIAGTTVLGVGVCAGSGPLLIAGAGVVVVSLLVTWGLHLAGWGKPSGPRPRDQWDWRVRDAGAREGHTECVGCLLAGRGRKPAAPAPVRNARPAARGEARAAAGTAAAGG